MKTNLMMICVLFFTQIGTIIAQNTRNFDPCYMPQALDAIKGRANIEADIPFAPYDNSKPYDSHKGKGEIGYYYAFSKGCNGQKILTKPIIIIDGFDPGDVRNIPNIYGQRLTYNSDQNLGDSLRSLGYDVIILNFPKQEVARVNVFEYFAIPHPFLLSTEEIAQAIPTPLNPNPTYKLPVFQDHGADYVERNAFTLVKLIEQTNAQLIANGSTEKIVIVGPSMGGLISRYALAWMEQNGRNHNTRLWVSFDSPHNGANIPIGAQKFLEHLAYEENNHDSKITVNNRLDAIAAKQMLLSHHLAKEARPNYVPPFPGIPDPFPFYKSVPLFRQGLVNALNEVGYPQNLRKIAMVNGAINGTLYDGSSSAGQETLYLEVDKRTGSLNFPIWEGKPLIRGNVYFGQSNGNTGIIARYAERGLLGAIFGTWSEKEYGYTSATGSVAYDLAPGGTYDLFEEIADEGGGNGWEWPVAYSANFRVRKKGHSFIPTKSALAFKGTNQDLGESLNNRNLICTNETPFDAYYAPSTNEGHTDLNNENVAWFLNQLNLTNAPIMLTFCNKIRDIRLESCRAGTITYQVSPNIQIISYQNRVLRVLGLSSGQGFVKFFVNGTLEQEHTVNIIKVSENDIVGSNTVCNSPQIYTLNNVPNFATVSWRTSGNLSPTSGSGNVATVTAIGGGDAWIEFVIGGCNQVIRKNINDLSSLENIIGKYAVCNTTSYSLPSYPNAIYNWTSSPNLTLSATNTASITATPIAGASGHAWVEVMITLNPTCTFSNTKLFRKELWIGVPATPILCNGNVLNGCTPISPPYNYTYCQSLGESETFSLLFSGAENQGYSVNGGAVVRITNNTVFVDKSQVGTFVYTIGSRNGCGISPTVTMTINIISCNKEAKARQESANVYPNPTKNILNIEATGENTFVLYNKFSQKMTSGAFIEKHILDLKQLPAGIYFLHIHDKNGNITQQQIIIEK